MPPVVWSHLGNHQPKTTRSFPVTRWLDHDTARPPPDRAARTALAEAVAIVGYGRSLQGRAALIADLVTEPANQEAWLRRLILQLRRSPG